MFLVGFMASGKSTVGRELARRLGWEFVDLDTRMESRERQGIPEIFRDRGEPGFRAAETLALAELTQSLERNSVVALGGGTFAFVRNQNLVRPWPSVFLETPLQELWQRSLDDATKRPLQKNTFGEFADLYYQRLPFYHQATATVDTSGKDPAAICAAIEVALQLGPVQANCSSESGGSR